MDSLFKTYGRLLADTDLGFTRYLYDKINWDNVADIELQINYTTGSLGMNSDNCKYDMEGNN